MPLVPAKCPECGGNINIDSKKRAAICEFCKQPFVVEDAINNFNTTYNITNNNEIKADVVNVYESKSQDFVIKAGELIEYNGASTNVIIPDSVIRIGESVFANSLVQSISIPNTVIEIGQDAFKGSQIKSIIIPNSVTKIGNGLFAQCNLLEEIELPDSIHSLNPDGFGTYSTMFEECTSLTKVKLPANITEIPQNMFYKCTELREIDIPDGVTVIGKGAFLLCEKLERVKLPKSLKKIGSIYGEGPGVFQYCKFLKEITIPENVEIIGNYSFEFCEKLTSIKLPESINRIGEHAFSNCNNLRNIHIDKELFENKFIREGFLGTVFWIENAKSLGYCPYCGHKLEGLFTKRCTNPYCK